MEELLASLNDVLKRSDMFQSHHVERERLSTRERMSQVLARLEGDNFISFYSLFRPEEGRAGVVVTFLAIMELVKERLANPIEYLANYLLQHDPQRVTQVKSSGQR